MKKRMTLLLAVLSLGALPLLAGCSATTCNSCCNTCGKTVKVQPVKMVSPQPAIVIQKR